MRLEEDIRQKKFETIYHKLAVNLHFTDSWLRTKEHKVLKKYGLSAQQYNVLRILKGQHPNPSTLVLIRERMIDRESNASRLIDKLNDAGLTNRVMCKKDRRRVDITITEKGLQLLEKVNPEIRQLTEKLNTITTEEAETLNNLLDKLRN